jgi:hypothetical protein
MDTFEHAGFGIAIQPDEDAESPDSWGNENLFLVTTSNRYFTVQRKGFGVEACRTTAVERDFHVLPLFAYIHSGVALSLAPFSDPWDSGQIGFVLVAKRKGFRNILKAARELVEEWNMYLSGDVWHYRVLDSQGDHVDSCSGFYGFEYCQQQARQAAEHARGLRGTEHA